MAARHEERYYEQNIVMYSLSCKGISDDAIEVAGDTAFQEKRPGVDFKIGDFVK